MRRRALSTGMLLLLLSSSPGGCGCDDIGCGAKLELTIASDGGLAPGDYTVQLLLDELDYECTVAVVEDSLEHPTCASTTDMATPVDARLVDYGHGAFIELESVEAPERVEVAVIRDGVLIAELGERAEYTQRRPSASSCIESCPLATLRLRVEESPP